MRHEQLISIGIMGSFGLVSTSIIFFLSLSLITTTTAQICNTDDLTVNSTYIKNRNLVLSSLLSNVTASGGFYNETIGQDPDKVYGLALCRGDLSIQSCYDCVNSSAHTLINHKDCSNKKEGITWEDDRCIVRFSYRSFFGRMDAFPFVLVQVTPNVSSNIFDQFDQVWTSLVQRILSEAAMGSSKLKFATGEEKVTAFQKIYALVQCTPDISQSQCSDCLMGAASYFQNCCRGNVGGSIRQPSCILSFNSNRFYELTAADDSSPPSPSPPLIANYPPPSTNRTSAKDNSSSTSKKVVVIVVPILVVLTVIVPAFAIFRMRRPKEKFEDEDTNYKVESLQFDINTVEAATNDFSDANMLGKGGFGSVYKGMLSNGQEIAVKRLEQSSTQGEVEFKNEVVTMAKLQHRNLVRFLGFCLDGTERLLIYEFMPNSSLDRFIFDPIRRLLLNWERRFQIIRGIARGILYLHEDSQLRIIHRDLKAGNVLLDEKMNPKIADFGMARLFVVDQSQGNTKRIVGTFGYMAPEYAYNGHISVKTDVFSFGVLILEIVSGKKNSFVRKSGHVEHLPSYAWKKWRDGKALNLIDPTLRGNSTSEIMRCIHIGLLCVQENMAQRPHMASVVLMLSESSTSLPQPSQPAFLMQISSSEPNVPSLHISGVPGSGQSANQSLHLSVNEASISELYGR